MSNTIAADHPADDLPGDPMSAMSELSRLLATEEDIDKLLRHLVDLAVLALPGGFQASITLIEGRMPRTAAASAVVVLPIDRAQYDAGSGPCVEAALTQAPVRVDVEEAGERWPEFTQAAKQAGFLGYLCSPLLLEGECIGAFNLFNDRIGDFDGVDEALLTLFVTAALAASAGARRSARAHQLADQFEQAMRTRQYIGEAAGVLAERHSLALDAAFDALVQQSQRSNTPLRDVALAITGREAGPEEA